MDVDDQLTWPGNISEFVFRVAERLRGSTDYACDLRISELEALEFRHILHGALLRVYHSTRLLGHEERQILTEGLRPLSRELVAERIAGARATGFISAEEAELLRQSTTFSYGDHSSRAGQVCLSLSNGALQEVHGCLNLLSIWGGEAIYRYVAHNEAVEVKLHSIGRPSVVVAAVGLGWAPGDENHHDDPRIPRLLLQNPLRSFVGVTLGLEKVGADINYKRPIPAEHILAIWHPGDPPYDTYQGLPSS